MIFGQKEGNPRVCEALADRGCDCAYLEGQGRLVIVPGRTNAAQMLSTIGHVSQRQGCILSAGGSIEPGSGRKHCSTSGLLCVSSHLIQRRLSTRASRSGISRTNHRLISNVPDTDPTPVGRTLVCSRLQVRWEIARDSWRHSDRLSDGRHDRCCALLEQVDVLLQQFLVNQRITRNVVDGSLISRSHRLKQECGYVSAAS